MAIHCPLCGRGHGEYCLKAGRMLRPDEGLEGSEWDTDFEEALNELNRVIVQNSKITKTNNNIAKANNVTTQDIQAHADIMAKFLMEEEKAAYFYNANANDIHDPSRVGVCKVKANEDIKVEFGITY